MMRTLLSGKGGRGSGPTRAKSSPELQPWRGGGIRPRLASHLDVDVGRGSMGKGLSRWSHRRTQSKVGARRCVRGSLQQWHVAGQCKWPCSTAAVAGKERGVARGTSEGGRVPRGKRQREQGGRRGKPPRARPKGRTTGPARRPAVSPFSFSSFLNFFSQRFSNIFLSSLKSFSDVAPEIKVAPNKILYNFTLRCNPKIQTDFELQLKASSRFK